MPWAYGQTFWDYLCTSYGYNNMGLYALRADEVGSPSLTIMMGASGWGAIHPNLPANDLWTVTNDPRA